jgi:hypothetical protein
LQRLVGKHDERQHEGAVRQLAEPDEKRRGHL